MGRMLNCLGVAPTLCGPFGGETGRVVRILAETDQLAIRAVKTAGSNGAYIHDRRRGERVPVAETPPHPLSRHELDELYGAALVGGLEAAVCVLGGPGPWDPPVLPPDTYRRLAGDLRANGKVVVADLSGEPLRCALKGGVTVLKVSHEALVSDGWAEGDNVDDLLEAMIWLREEGAEHVLVTRAEAPALALVEGVILEVVPPRLERWTIGERATR